jgi:hypothetical protein
VDLKTENDRSSRAARKADRYNMQAIFETTDLTAENFADRFADALVAEIVRRDPNVVVATYADRVFAAAAGEVEAQRERTFALPLDAFGFRCCVAMAANDVMREVR